jgi:hypothetical protein
MTPRYCIGCVKLVFIDKCRGYGTPQTGSWTIDEAGVICKAGHWQVELLNDKPLDLSQAMEKAQDCLDFEERKLEEE